MIVVRGALQFEIIYNRRVIVVSSGRLIVSYAVWLYYRFNLSHRDIEDLLAERGIIVSREAIRLWYIKFGAIYTVLPN
ncbi:MAG: hypothetical protein V7742_22595 [Halioglobus sp.]